MSLAMTKAEREAFLADVHIGVVGIPEPGAAPVTVPIWYRYAPGGPIEFITDRDSRKGRLLAVGKPLALCAQTEQAPYKYVTVEGVVTAIAPVDVERDLRPIAQRYLGPARGDAYVDAMAPEMGGSVLVRVRPERWLTVDYAKEPSGL
jgi:nitroimidazol reductase NimA-like FMN-containing flavoprotein (pyridoxamine 5'-phosphate oxidase superfamily)